MRTCLSMTRSGEIHFNIALIRIHIRMEKYHVRNMSNTKKKHKTYAVTIKPLCTITYHWEYFVRS